jgi:hypothetical protein
MSPVLGLIESNSQCLRTVIDRDDGMLSRRLAEPAGRRPTDGMVGCSWVSIIVHRYMNEHFLFLFKENNSSAECYMCLSAM